MSKFPASCNVCPDRHVCGSQYGSSKCHYHPHIEAARAMKDLEGRGEVPIRQEDVVGNPSHYKHGRFEVIDEMLLAFGPQRTYDFCILNAWKYRARAPFKGNPEQDLKKADQYLTMAREIAEANKEQMGYGQAPVGLIKE